MTSPVLFPVRLIIAIVLLLVGLVFGLCMAVHHHFARVKWRGIMREILDFVLTGKLPSNSEECLRAERGRS